MQSVKDKVSEAMKRKKDSTKSEKMLYEQISEDAGDGIDNDHQDSHATPPPAAASSSGSSISSNKSVAGETSAAIIYEQAIDKTNQLIVSNLSWANAALLALALPNTIQISEWSDVANAWFYFVIIFLSALALAVLPRTWEDPEEVRRELELKPLQDAQDKAQELQKAEQKIEEKMNENENNEQLLSSSNDIVIDRRDNNNDPFAASSSPRSPSSSNSVSSMSGRRKSTAQIIRFVEVEADALGENLEDVLTFTVGNVVAMSLRDAAKYTFEAILGKDDDNMTTTLWVFYAIFVSIVTVTLTIKLGNLFEVFEAEIRRDIIEQGLTEAKDEMILFALRKRALNLTTTTLSLCMAWAWRDAIKSLILAMYEGDTSTLAHIWIYALTATALATFNNAVCSQYILLYPRSEKIPNLQLGTTSRNLIDKTFANNINYIAAFAWYDCAKSTFEEIGSWEVWQKTLFYWFVAISMQILSFALQYIWNKHQTKVQIAEKGLAKVFLSFNKIFDPKGKLDSNKKTGNEENVETFYWAFTVAFITLCIYACGTSSSLFVTLSLKYTISAAYSKYYDLDSGDVPTDSIWMVWIALLISIGISVLIVTYFSRLINAAKKVRRSIVGKEKEKHRKHAQSMRDVRPELAGDNDNDNREYGAGNINDDNGAVVISHSRTMNDNGDGQGYGDSKDMNNNDDNNDNNDNNEYDSEKEKEKRRHEIKSTKTIDEGLGMTSVVLGGSGSGGTGADDGGDDAGGDDAGGDAADAGDADGGDGQN